MKQKPKKVRISIMVDPKRFKDLKKYYKASSDDHLIEIALNYVCNKKRK